MFGRKKEPKIVAKEEKKDEVKEPVVWVKCPKCDLNYMQKGDKLCELCKQGAIVLASKNDSDAECEGMRLCPICKINYITEDESVCATCMDESDLTEEELEDLYGHAVDDKDTGTEEIEDDDDIILTVDGEEEEEEEETTEESSGDPLDDFDESLVEDDTDDDDDK